MDKWADAAASANGSWRNSFEKNNRAEFWKLNRAFYHILDNNQNKNTLQLKDKKAILVKKLFRQMQVLISDNFLVFSFSTFFVDQYQNIKIYKTEKVPLRIKCPKAEMLCNPQKSFKKIRINNLYLVFKLELYFSYHFIAWNSK